MPSSGALFGSAVTGPGSTHGAKHLVEMRAGRMNLKGKMVYPDKRKGLLYVYQSDDSLMHFCWKDRTTGVVEDDLIIFPDDCEYIRVPQCTTGRVYLLKFKSSNRRFFFWLQEPRTDRDDESCKKINEFLNNPPGPGSVGGSSTVSGGSGGLAGADQDLQSLLNNMSQSQLMQLFGGVGQIGGLSSLLGTMSRPSTGNSRTAVTTPTVPRYNATATATTPTNNATTSSVASTTPTNTQASAQTVITSFINPPKLGSRSASVTSTPRPNARTAGNPIQLADLQNLLQGITPAAEQQQVDLSSALTTEALAGILNDSDALNQLQEHLPAVGGSNQDQLRSTLQSPQFQQAVSMFSSALQSGQLAPVVEQLAVNPEAVVAASQGDMQGFVQALEKGSEAAESSNSEPKVDKPSGADKKLDDDDDDEGMQLG